MYQQLGLAARPAFSGAIEAIVAERLLRLDPPARLVLELAALLVREVEPALLAGALGWSRRAVLASLERGRADHLLARDAAATPRFAHALIRAAIRSHIERCRLPGLHGRLATALERRPDATARVDELAHYWWEAGVATRSRVYDEQAGDAALNVNAADAAATHYRRARAACERGSASDLRLSLKLSNIAALEGEAWSGS
jgi:predicted ATPase